MRATDVLRAGLPTTRLTRIVDVGANPVETPPYRDLLSSGGCDLIGFEPHEQAFQELQTAKGPNEHYEPLAVGDGSPVTFHAYEMSGLSSVFPPYEGAFRFLGRSRRNMRLVEASDMTTTRLDDVPSVADMDLLKIDIQGGEVAVFDGAPKALKDTMAVIVEARFYQLYESEPMIGGVDTALRTHGFQLHKFMFQKAKVLPSRWKNTLKARYHRNQVIDGDAVYLKDLTAPETIATEKLCHLAILASAVFESHDLTLHCLDILATRDVIDPSLGAAYVAALPADLRA